MTERTNLSSFLLLLSIVILFAGCGSDPCDDLAKQVKRTISDNSIDEAEWDKIQAFVSRNKESLANSGCDCSTDEALANYITDLGKSRRGSIASEAIAICCASADNRSTTNTTLSSVGFDFYLESSGSMYPYAASNSEFKSAIYDLLTRFPNDNTINYVGSVIYPVEDGVRDFIKKIDPYDVAKANKRKINTSSTDINGIIESIIDNTKPGRVGVLVSDFIYSIKGGDTRDALSKLKFITKDIFKGKSGNYAVLALKMSSSYKGSYYDYTDNTHRYNGERPYYIFMMGENAAIDAILTDSKYREIANFENLKGYENYHLFSNSAKGSDPYFSILNNTNKKGRFYSDRKASSSGQIKGIEKVEMSDRDGEDKLEFAVAVDLSDIFLSDSYKSDVNNYLTDARDDFEVIDVEKIGGNTVEQSDRKYLSSATHVLTVRTTQMKAKEQNVSISLKKKLPQWIENSSTTDDRAIMSDPNLEEKTFGLNYLMEGIDEAYNTKGSAPTFFDINFSVKQ